MIRFFHATNLADHADLAAAMFRDRAAQFRDRHRWDVTVDALGWETDPYDALDPLYVVAVDGAGGHAGSLRLLPTAGPTMLADHFAHLAPCPAVPGTWEATRFCQAPGAARDTARRVLAGVSQAALSLGLRHLVGVYDAPMARVYRRLGWEPAEMGRDGAIVAGRWTVSDAAHDRVCAGAGLSAHHTLRWFERDLGHLAEAG
ncbi:acyl-homoserine-lactone synthase [Jannaschia sp. W003]|uniref:acyl-homoserine-lactone synthase n=1 Tax=Jannaschia sp. W003 TaxID=2867012 RepID=UPI0021A8A59B|nr:acyl-homoserine-lactone synthase [Jannaschia sp. W003]UWQ21663.1 autoinducer synthase [Jannaschia sp. W003]